MKFEISNLKFRAQPSITDKVRAVCRMFGLTIDQVRKKQISINCQLKINPGDIVYITGPSGSGKTMLMRELEKSIPKAKRINLARMKPHPNRTVIDCIDADFLTTLRVLSIAGLADVFCVLNTAGNLSDGQKYRLRLAMALAKSSPIEKFEVPQPTARAAGQKKFIFADEFCSHLDRITAAVISAGVHKFAKRYKVAFILASSHEDILLDLAPDCIVQTDLSGQTQVIYKYVERIS